MPVRKPLTIVRIGCCFPGGQQPGRVSLSYDNRLHVLRVPVGT